MKWREWREIVCDKDYEVDEALQQGSLTGNRLPVVPWLTSKPITTVGTPKKVDADPRPGVGTENTPYIYTSAAGPLELHFCQFGLVVLWFNTRNARSLCTEL